MNWKVAVVFVSYGGILVLLLYNGVTETQFGIWALVAGIVAWWRALAAWRPRER